MILPLRAGTSSPDVRLEEIEQVVAACDPRLLGSRVAAFTLGGGRLVVAVEISRRLLRLWELDLVGGENPVVAELKAAIHRAVERRCRAPVESVVLVPRGALPQAPDRASLRSACRAAYLKHALRRVD